MINLLVLAAGVAAAPATSTCNADNCLRAVRASAFPTVLGTRDCSSYLLATVTPATSTSTVTVTISPTSTFSVTVTNTQTLIDSVTATSTATVTDTITITSDVDITSTVLQFPSLAPRQVTVQPSHIPTYASACSNSVRYSSACSCIGVTKSTTTAATPVTVITVTATAVKDLTLTHTSSALATSYVTETAFATNTLDVSTTVTDTVTAATTTVLACPPQPTSLILQAVGGPYAGQYAVLVSVDADGDYVIVFTTNEAAATTFNIDGSGHLNAFGYYANTNMVPDPTLLPLYFNSPSAISADDYVYATCTVAPTGAVTCEDQGSTMFQINPGTAATGLDGDGVVIGPFVEAGSTGFSFAAICT